ncbi:hypothetical protein LOZ53_000535 [Ophidiomyces ophidiicola]|nr:hypothetical protein LOZ55_000798 [Ophidiomyces ophidiicola]KAI1992414.1 hypothetical protein LOZ54_001763 [Ophidiomyces ophidiicola]KAI1997528.1 hypothetical protein LOZ53_000535 [Ophidiomyces ophidiicola]KAI1998040.1 hypothetical protein LOZ51_002714 [Ophidiomyces ophidiicola]
MVLPVAAAAALVAGSATVGAYLNAKYHIHQDLSAIFEMKAIERAVARAAASGTMSTWYLFEDKVKKYPHARCIWTREVEYTFQETYDLVCRYANYFLSLGITRGDLVAVYLQNCAEFPIVWTALWAIGCAPALINYHLAGPALLHCLKVSSGTFLLVDPSAECLQRIEEQKSAIETELGMTPLVLDDALKASIETFPATLPDDSLRRGISGDAPSCLFYTSGTTGLPKASAFTMARLHATALMGARRDRPGVDGDVWYNCMPLYHGTGGVRLQVCLCSGAAAAIGQRFSTRSFWREVVDARATHFIYVGETARYLLAAPASALDRAHGVRGVYGNGLRPDVWEAFRERFGIAQICEFFNSTEGMFGLVNVNHGAYTAACVGHHGALLRWLLRDTYVPVAVDAATGDIARDPATGFAVRSAYEDGGEMLVAVADEQAFQGYWRNAAATQQKFVRDVFRAGDLWYRTGDALRRSADGHWHFLDRLGDTFRWKSENVSTAEVAAVLGQYAGVVEANVYGVALPHYEGRAGCAAVLLAPGAAAAADARSFDWSGLVRHARARLPRYAVPVFIRLVRASNHIHNNKQNKVPLRAEGVDPAKRGTQVPDGAADRILWMTPGDDTYREFTVQDWESLVASQVRL